MQRTLVQAHGNWVEGERFWNREHDKALMIERLDEGAHIEKALRLFPCPGS
jgi:hypothetical protein